MKKNNKLYTVNKWNLPIWEGLAQNAGMDTGDYMKSTNLFGLSKIDNPFSKGNLQGGIKSMAGTSIGKGLLTGLSGVASTGLQSAISGGYNSGAGSAIGNVGRTAGSIVSQFNPALGALVNVGSGVLGGGVNALVGTKVDQEALNTVRGNINNLQNFTSNVGSFDEIRGRDSVGGVGNIYQGGLLKKGWARRHNESLQNELMKAADFADRSIANNVDSLKANQMNDALANYAAFGGQIPTVNYGGALGIMQQDKYINAINNRTSALAQKYEAPAAIYNKYDNGGDFIEGFSKDPIAAAMQYTQQLDAQDAAREAEAESLARQKAYDDMQQRLMATETQNQGLQSLLNSQAMSISALQEAQRNLAEAQALQAAAPVETTSEAPQEALQEVVDMGDYSNLKKFIKKHEGFMSKAYWLPGESAPTIGYGFHTVYPGTNKKVQMGDKITKAQAEQYLDTALGNLESIISKKVPNWGNLNKNQRDALIDLAYGTGPYSAHFKKNSKLFRALAAGDMAAAAANLYAGSASKKEYNKFLEKISKNRKDMFLNGNYELKAFGGELGTNGTDFTNGLLEINTGGSHEDSPYSGVPMGFDRNGVPNLVEEGETVFNNYVFSNRLVVPKFMRKQLGLGGSLKKDITFADASKKIADDSKERPNNPMDEEGLKAALGKLAEVQESERMLKQAQDRREQEAAELLGLASMLQQQGDTAADAAGTVAETQMACGGKLKYANGGKLKGKKNIYDTGTEGFDRSNIQPYAYSKDWTGFKYFNPATGKYDEKYLEFANNISQDWVNRIFSEGHPYGDMSRYLAKNKDTMPTPAQVAGLATDMKYSDMHKAMAAAYEDYLKGMNPATGEINATPVTTTSNVGPYENAGIEEPSPTNVGPYAPTEGYTQGFWGPGAGNVSFWDAATQTGYPFGDPDKNNGMFAGAPAPIYVPVDSTHEIEKAKEAERIKARAARERNNTIPEDENPYTYATWMRYAPVFGAGIMSLTDALGLTNKHDYTYANKLEAAANRLGYAPDIRAPYIGDYMRYRSLDRLFYANQLQANARATDRGLMNTAGGNSGAAAAGLLANGYNSQLGLGNLYRQGEEYNLNQYAQAKDFNRRTNMFNAQMGLEAAMANARYRQQAGSAQLSGLAQAAALRDAIDQRVGASRSANLTNFLQSLGNIGRENFAMNQINWDRSRRYKGKLNGTSWYDSPYVDRKTGKKKESK